ncbi:MAG: hypothetical protein NC489_23705, partial [Ruminococcus flavefaciens]|nr:hypothetical protein [Ruminococcus flavefaciens]
TTKCAVFMQGQLAQKTSAKTILIGSHISKPGLSIPDFIMSIFTLKEECLNEHQRCYDYQS